MNFILVKCTESILYLNHTILAFIAEKLGLHPYWKATQLIVDTWYSEQSKHESYREVTHKVHENSLEIEIDTILHAISAETHYYRPHP